MGGQVQGHSDPIMECGNSSSHDSSHNACTRYAPDTIILKTRSVPRNGTRTIQRCIQEVKVKVTWYSLVPRCIYIFIWNSYLKEYRRNAPNSMQFLETRSEVKFKVTVTQLWYAALCHPNMHPHTKFMIPTLNNIRDMLQTRLF